jgi:hypothetical protein
MREGLQLRAIVIYIGVIAATASSAPADESTVSALLSTLKAVGPQNGGQREAKQAWRALAAVDARQLPAVLAGLDDASPLAANWIRSAVDAIVEGAEVKRASLPGQATALPRAELERFMFDTTHAPRARRLAYEILLRGEPGLADQVLPKMLDDPSLELRRDAVACVLSEADRLAAIEPIDQERTVATYQKALDAARDLDQVKHAAEQLTHFGHSVDLPRHFGFITTWHVVGPFDNRDQKGFAVAFPPETNFDFAASDSGKNADVKWHEFVTNDPYGQVDLNRAVGKHLGAVAYAAAEFDSDRDRDVELRLGTENACKLWLNGKLLLESEVYHSFTSMDQFVGRGRMKKGRNLILLKICQNEQTEDWAQVWQFQLRVCDATGTASLPRDRATKVEGGSRR